MARDRTRDNLFPGADTLPTELPGAVKKFLGSLTAIGSISLSQQ